MKSPFFALLLIVNLLACPVRCLSCEANVTTGEICAPVTCRCCEECENSPVPELPEPCGDDCNCQNCICEGAVVEADVELPDAEFLVSWFVPERLVIHSVVGPLEFMTRQSLESGGQLLSGRDVRVAHQSWLI